MKIEIEMDGIRFAMDAEFAPSRFLSIVNVEEARRKMFEDCVGTLKDLAHHYIDAKFNRTDARAVTLGPPPGATILPLTENGIPDEILCTGERLKINTEEVTK